MKHYGVVESIVAGEVTSIVYDRWGNRQYRFHCRLSRFKEPDQVIPGFMFVRIRTGEVDYFEWYWSWRARNLNAPIYSVITVKPLEDYVMTNEVMVEIDASIKSGAIDIPADINTAEEMDAWIMSLDLGGGDIAPTKA